MAVGNAQSLIQQIVLNENEFYKIRQKLDSFYWKNKFFECPNKFKEEEIVIFK